MPVFDLPPPNRTTATADFDVAQRNRAFVEVKITYHSGTIEYQYHFFDARDVTKISRSTGLDLGLSTGSLGGANGQIEIRMSPNHFRAPLTVGTRQVNNTSGTPVYTNMGPDNLTDQVWIAWSGQTATIWRDQFRLWRLLS